MLRYFDNGYYHNELVFNYDGEQPMVVGVRDDVGGTQTWAEVTNFRLFYNGDQTGISDVINSYGNAGVYSIDGRKLPSIRKGVNIMKDADGSAKKVLMK